ncbi:MAG: VOC family protein, partial [Balneola sp.]|nr:VOC family protein [Balneola sp.]
FQVPEGTEGFWKERLNAHNIEHSDIFEVFGNPALRFQDPDGLELDLIFSGQPKEKVSAFETTVPTESSIQGFWSTRLKVADPDATAGILKDIFKFEEKESEEKLTRFATDAQIGSNVIIEKSDDEQGKGGRGIVHHVAFRAQDEEELAELREKVVEKGLHPSPIIDRHWFKSVYFREPSGVLFEIASDGPGYAVDEDFEELGETLILPPWLEPRRKIIEDNLPDLGI